MDSKLPEKLNDSDFEYFKKKQLLLRKPKSNTTVKQAAVMILCYPKAGTMQLTLIKRSDYIGVHAGQIGLPGGKKEISDRSLWHTAQRECNEELGTELSKDKPLLILSSIYIPPSHFNVTPFVTVLSHRPNFKLDPREVDHLIELPLGELCSFQIKERVLKEGRNIGMQVPSFRFKDYIIWGATAFILFEFKTFLVRQL